MLRLADGITMDVINSLIYTSKVVIESESVIFSDFDYFANI